MKTLVLASALALAAGPVMAQQMQCMEREKGVAALQEKYGESQQMAGFERRGVIMEMWANADTGTWTLFFVRPDGLACQIGSGENFRRTDNPPAVPEKES